MFFALLFLSLGLFENSAIVTMCKRRYVHFRFTTSKSKCFVASLVVHSVYFIIFDSVCFFEMLFSISISTSSSSSSTLVFVTFPMLNSLMILLFFFVFLGKNLLDAFIVIVAVIAITNFLLSHRLKLSVCVCYLFAK